MIAEAHMETHVFDMQAGDAPMFILLGVGVVITIGLAIFFFVVLRKKKDEPQ
jgi:LPXTG-motif cell wall-anchored protein